MVYLRRKFIGLLGGAAAWPLAARAQQASAMARVGVLAVDPDNPQIQLNFPAFQSELQRLGFTQGQNLAIEYRRIDVPEPVAYANAEELVRWKPDVLVSIGPELALKAARAATTSVPIVFTANNYDPIARGYVQSLARPGGNVTGMFYRQPELAGKQLELLVESFPDRRRVAALWDSLSADQFSVAASAAKAMRLDLSSHRLDNPPYDFAASFRDIARAGAQAVLALSSSHFTMQRSRIAELAIEHRLPTMFIFKSYVKSGGLMSYGVDTVPMLRRVGSLVAKILRGAEPADLPVEQAAIFEFAVNLKTARAIGVTLPTSILLRADEVIE